MKIPESIERVANEFAKLPGIGKKTALRLAFSLLKSSPEEAHAFASAIVEVKEKIRSCQICFSLTEQETCSICQDPLRKGEILCVVEQPNNIFPIEKSGVFQGRYHVLMGAISPLDGIGPNQIKFKELVKRVETEKITEIILATNPTVNGEATALFLQQELIHKVEKITRLARGLPAGSDLEYVDHVTLTQAFSARQSF